MPFNTNPDMVKEIEEMNKDDLMIGSSNGDEEEEVKVEDKVEEEVTDEKEEEMVGIAEEIKNIDQNLDEISQKEADFQKRVSREALNREIKVFEQLNRNVRIDISGKEFYIDDPLSAVKIFRFKDDIVIESLSDIEDQNYDIFVPST